MRRLEVDSSSTKLVCKLSLEINDQIIAQILVGTEGKKNMSSKGALVVIP